MLGMPRSRVWEWRYSGIEGISLVASGTLVTTGAPDPDGWFVVESISGGRAGVEIEALHPAGTGIPGNVRSADGLFHAGSNRIRMPTASDVAQLDGQGLQFALVDGTFSNVFYASFLDSPCYLDFHSVPPFPAGAAPPNSEPPVAFHAEIASAR